MATITAPNVQTLTDAIAKHIVDLQALVGSPTALNAGQTTTLNHIAALNDATQQFLLLTGFNVFVGLEQALIASYQSYNAILDSVAPAVVAINNVAPGGLAAFCAANNVQVHPVYFDAHNRAVATGRLPGAVLPVSASFNYADANIAQITLTGAGAGTFAAQTAENANYGNAPLSIFNAGAGATGAAAGTYTVTYNAYNTSTGALQTGLTASATMPAASIAGAAVTLAVSGVAVTAITLTGGTAGDKIGVSAALQRTPAY